jgi:hypothetical protein
MEEGMEELFELEGLVGFILTPPESSKNGFYG